MVKRSFRADLQMLRAIAVLLVIFDHLEILQRLPGHPLGGFIGVDIFFVLSGFLITSQLVRHRLEDGRISFRDFYTRRARRILPMAVLVVVLVVCASYALFWISRANQYALDGLWSLLFVANIAFAVAGTDYFATDAPSIFQHYWSLSVEEQFYIFWPFVILLGGALALRSRKPRLTLAVIAGLVGVLSLLWACLDTLTNPVSAYFSTFARTFEFAAGATLAIVAPALVRLPDVFRLPIALMGLLGLVASVWIIDPAVGFPGPMALLPVLATVLVVAAGTGREGGQRIPLLTSRSVSYVGDISYSLYLWHWPVIVIAAAFIPSQPIVALVALAVTAGLSALSYRYVEQAVQSSGWLLRSGRSVGRVPTSRAVVMMGTGVVVAALILGGTAGMVRATAESQTSVTALDVLVTPQQATELVGDLQEAIEESVSSSNWGGLIPAVDNLGDGVASDLEECWTGREEAFNTCERGSSEAQHSLVLLGDSIAMTYAPALLQVLHELDANLRIYTKAGCPAAALSVLSTDGSPYVACNEFRERAIAEIQANPPDLILTASALTFETASPVSSESRAQLLAEGWAETLGALSSAADIVVLTAPPQGPDLAVCANRFNSPADCAGAVGDRWLSVRAVLESVAANADATLIDSAPWFCTPSGICPANVGNLIVRRDKVHLTREYSESLAPVMAASLAHLLR